MYNNYIHLHISADPVINVATGFISLNPRVPLEHLGMGQRIKGYDKLAVYTETSEEHELVWSTAFITMQDLTPVQGRSHTCLRMVRLVWGKGSG